MDNTSTKPLDATLRQLLQQIILNPKDDTVRLVYADRCEELGDIERAEFIRTQIELAKYPIRKIIDKDEDNKEGIYYSDRAGPNYYELLDMIGYHYELKHGERVDVLLGKRKKAKWYYGLRVLHIKRTRNEEDFFLVRDEHSIPEPDHIKQMREREKELLLEHLPDWAYLGFGPSSTGMSRGFISAITCTAEDFLKHADSLIWVKNTQPMPKTAQPIEKIKLTTWPDWETWTREETLTHLCKEWPNIEFELPTSYPGATDTYIPDFNPIAPAADLSNLEADEDSQ